MNGSLDLYTRGIGPLASARNTLKLARFKARPLQLLSLCIQVSLNRAQRRFRLGIRHFELLRFLNLPVDLSDSFRNDPFTLVKIRYLLACCQQPVVLGNLHSHLGNLTAALLGPPVQLLPPRLD